MPRRSPGARAVGIGAELRRLREAKSLSLRRVAEAVGIGPDKLSRVENGKQNPDVDDVSAVLAILGVTGETRERILDEVRNVDEPGWWERHLGITKESAALADYESRAEHVIDWAPLVIPGLLQTMDYAGAVMEMYGIGAEDIGVRLGARRERQRAAADTSYDAYIGESALRTVVGSPGVMHAQLGTLLDIGGRRSVRVVPSAGPAHLGQLGGFILLRFRSAPSVVHVELLRSGVFLDRRELTDPYLNAVTQVSAVALTETESAHLIRQVRQEMEG
ncbi:hypothetical protein BLA60_21360 [Actinophytocola xinjiangensis]|uniref:HTH cro/C1-type domain-containing protein n=1 Tax=Actinophytocola xinjiangensis TaxID=485602 RepID=A0A7Z0WK08_9PSEU|nr:helix-turn-helix transcriptional regulator [Actinophytocola xinjiangensis]OLF09125.1 hypothetical protein BLA60_21360 [Actinophytocola xinjiangensis]